MSSCLQVFTHELFLLPVLMKYVPSPLPVLSDSSLTHSSFLSPFGHTFLLKAFLFFKSPSSMSILCDVTAFYYYLYHSVCFPTLPLPH